MIHISHLSKVYKTGDIETKALNDVSFDVKEGEFVAIMGPSGSGKSTLMHMIGALDTPTSGEYTLDGEDVGKLSDDELADIRNRKIGFVFQAFNLLPRGTALQNVILPMVYAGVAKKEREEKAKKYLEIVGLGDRLNHTSNQAAEIMAIFQGLNEEGHTIIMITHESDIARHTKRIIHIKDGRIIKNGIH